MAMIRSASTPAAQIAICYYTNGQVSPAGMRQQSCPGQPGIFYTILAAPAVEGR
jgi:hypothetical protein